LKPANIFITFNGVLKIGDFGLASSWPAPKGIEGEGDREYISPEVLLGVLDKPADVFAIGLITLEIAGNFFLPDNGEQWQRLRSGNLSDVPSLTWSTDSRLSRDEEGDPLAGPPIQTPKMVSSADLLSPTANQLCFCDRKTTCSHDRRQSELQTPPAFMLDGTHAYSLDRLVAMMLAPDPNERPDVNRILDSAGLAWVAGRRRSGATVYEGNWGPSDNVLARTGWSENKDKGDVEMQDV
jgi:mitosis inhibitor protein kinase SWE1